MVDKTSLAEEMVVKYGIKPSLADKLSEVVLYANEQEVLKTEMIVKRFGFTPTTAKRYLRQLVEYGYLTATGGNKNRSYIKA